MCSHLSNVWVDAAVNGCMCGHVIEHCRLLRLLPFGLQDQNQAFPWSVYVEWYMSVPQHHTNCWVLSLGFWKHPCLSFHIACANIGALASMCATTSQAMSTVLSTELLYKVSGLSQSEARSRWQVKLGQYNCICSVAWWLFTFYMLSLSSTISSDTSSLLLMLRTPVFEMFSFNFCYVIHYLPSIQSQKQCLA